MRVHRDDRSSLAFERALGSLLKIKVDREADILARDGKLLAHHPDLFAVRVDDHIPRSIRPAEDLVVRFLHARLPNNIPRRVERVLGIVEVRLRDLADVADHVRHEAVIRIQPPLLVKRFELRQIVAVRGDKRLLVRRDVLLQRNRLILRRRLVMPYGRLNLLDGHMQPARDERQVLLQMRLAFAQQEAADRRIVVDDDAAFAIEDAAARRKHRNLANAILLSQHAVVRRAEHLHAPQARAQHQQHKRDDILRSRELYLRELLAPAECIRVVIAEDQIRIPLNSLIAFLCRHNRSLAELEAIQQEEHRHSDESVHDRAD